MLVGDETVKKLEALEEVIEEYYYQEEDIDKEAMIDGLYSGLVDSLGDPYSVYYNEEEWQDLMQTTEGIYYGIGAYLSLDPATGLARIAGVIPDTPAEEAGLRENDIIYMVDEEQIQGLELSEIVSKVKGEEGTKVHLTIYREENPITWRLMSQERRSSLRQSIMRSMIMGLGIFRSESLMK